MSTLQCQRKPVYIEKFFQKYVCIMWLKENGNPSWYVAHIVPYHTCGCLNCSSHSMSISIFDSWGHDTLWLMTWITCAYVMIAHRVVHILEVGILEQKWDRDILKPTSISSTKRHSVMVLAMENNQKSTLLFQSEARGHEKGQLRPKSYIGEGGQQQPIL